LCERIAINSGQSCEWIASYKFKRKENLWKSSFAGNWKFSPPSSILGIIPAVLLLQIHQAFGFPPVLSRKKKSG
jgi:hypothetical protein